MRRLMVAALHSGAGKTAVTCALLAALKKRGLTVSAFKCGPDYIDPMFHTRVLGVESRNLDLFSQGPERVQQTLCRAGGDIAVIEGAMGFYDGIGGTDAASAWAVAEVVDAPVVLIVRPQSAALTLAAQIKGVLTFRPQSHIAGLLLNDCKPSLSAYLTPILQRETGLPVLGSLPHCAEAELSSRHLGAAPLETHLVQIVRRRCPSPAAVSPSRGTKRSAFIMRTAWTPCATRGRNYAFSAPCGTPRCQNNRMGCI